MYHAILRIKTSSGRHLLGAKTRIIMLHLMSLKTISYFSHEVWLSNLLESVLIALIFIAAFLNVLLVLCSKLLSAMAIKIIIALAIERHIGLRKWTTGILDVGHRLNDCRVILRGYALHWWIHVQDQVSSRTTKTLETWVILWILES